MHCRNEHLKGSQPYRPVGVWALVQSEPEIHTALCGICPHLSIKIMKYGYVCIDTECVCKSGKRNTFEETPGLASMGGVFLGLV